MTRFGIAIAKLMLIPVIMFELSTTLFIAQLIVNRHPAGVIVTPGSVINFDDSVNKSNCVVAPV